MFDRIEFDEAKNAANRAKHGLSLDIVKDADVVATVEDVRSDYGERRFVTHIRRQGRDMIRIWCVREDRARIISVFRARRRTLRSYGLMR